MPCVVLSSAISRARLVPTWLGTWRAAVGEPRLWVASCRWVAPEIPPLEPALAARNKQTSPTLNTRIFW